MGYGLWAFFFMPKIRISAFIDGFNLYHAIADLRQNHLKWIDLRKLCEAFAPASDFILSEIYYFSSYATWRHGPYGRHKEYVRALRAAEVIPIMGRFKEKEKYCRRCGRRWIDHEEKETDVNIAIHMLKAGYNNTCDRFLLISGDSDLVPAVRMIHDEFPHKVLKILFPIARSFSRDLINAAGGSNNIKKMKYIHLERSLFDEKVRDDLGRITAVRPDEYNPPA